MERKVRDYLEIREVSSLDGLIDRLTAIRDGLSHASEAEVRLRGDDHFGRHIAIAFKRPLTAEEAACERRYGTGNGLRAVA